MNLRKVHKVNNEVLPNWKNLRVLRGDIWFAELGKENVIDSEQNGFRPVLVLQNDVGNTFSTTIIVACMTKQTKNNLPTHMDCRVEVPSIAMFEQIKTISKRRLRKRVTHLNSEQMKEMNAKLKISLGLD